MILPASDIVFPRSVVILMRRSTHRAIHFLGAIALAAFAVGSTPSRPAPSMIGLPTIVQTEASDTLLDIARAYDVGFVEIREANPDTDPWMPSAGKPVRVPTQYILPETKARSGIAINLAELRLYYFFGSDVKSFPIGTGDEGKDTPLGTTVVARKATHPRWIPTASEHAENPDLPAIIGPGPDNPMGDFALYLGWSGFAIHGTNKPDSVGRRGSHGCIRLYPEDIEWLFRHVSGGTTVTVVDQPAKVAWSGGELYLEVHPLQADINAIEETGHPASAQAIDADALVLKAVGAEVARLDWYAIHLAEARRDGMPVQVTRSILPTD